MGKLICESWAQLYILSPGYQGCSNVSMCLQKSSLVVSMLYLTHVHVSIYELVYICEVDFNFTFVSFYVCKYMMIHYDSDMLNRAFLYIFLSSCFCFTGAGTCSTSSASSAK